MSAQSTILLYNPISNEGHLDSWHVLFIEIFLAAGWSVIPATTDPQALKSTLERKGLLNHPQLMWLATLEHERQTTTVKITNFYKRLLRQFKKVFQSAKQREQYLLASRFLDPQQFKNDIERTLNACPVRVDLIFNLFIDGYLRNSIVWNDLVFWQKADEAIQASIPWAGLCITPELDVQPKARPQAQSQSLAQVPSRLSKKMPQYYSLATYRGTCFLDEAAVQDYREVFHNKQFAFLPDITETDLPPEPVELALEVKRRAAGRTIVFMGGSIGKQKNLEKWIELILSADPQQWYFVQIGRISHNNLTHADAQALKRIEQQQPENFYVHADYLPDETSFNSIIATVDVIFAVYRDFYRSSNMLAKAAYFEKPILVADRCLMGERVTQYGIGLAVPADSLASIQAGLTAVLNIQDLPAKCASYRAAFNRTEFSRRLIAFATSCLSQPKPIA
jgi:hypothetical protein